MYHRNPIPPKDGGDCHRTGFTKSCHACVTQHGCKLWKRVAVIVERHPDTGEDIPADAYDCIDSIQELFMKDMLRRQLQTTATVDKLAKEVNENNQGSMRGFLTDINQEMMRISQQPNTEVLPNGAPAPKLLEG